MTKKSVSVVSVAVLVLFAALVQVGSTALAKAAPVAGRSVAGTITTIGPLTNISISPDLNCAVNHLGDSAGEWFADTACGTLILLNGSLYGPASIPAGDAATISETAAFTPVSQATTGAGTFASPYQTVTVVTAGATGVTLTETDTYVTGNEYYRTDVKIQNTTPVANAILYRAGDCFLQNSDFGYGWIDPNGGIACQAGTSTARGTRIEELKPITPGSRYMEDFYNTMWAAIGAKAQLPNTCKSPNNGCSDYLDNSVALSWNLTLPAGGTTTVSNLSLFAPLGVANVTVTATSDQPSLPAGGGQDGYAIRIANPNNGSTSVDSISDTLPGGFAYRAGTTTNVTTGDPSISGQTLTWTGPFAVPATSSITLHFQVDSSPTRGGYYNSATATSAAYGVTGSGNTAPVTVGLTKQAVLPALANGAYGGYTTVVFGKNSGASSATVFVAYYDAGGVSVGSGDNAAAVPVNAGFSFRQDSGNAFPTGGAGVGTIWSDQPVAAFVNEFAPGGSSDATSYTGVAVGPGTGTSLFAPTIAKNAYGGYTTGIGLINLGTAATDITITYRNGDGSTAGTPQVLAGVAAGAYQGVYTGGIASLPDGFAGSATITSANQLAAIVNETGPGGQFSSYDTVPVGNATLLAPTMLRNAYGGYNTGLALVETAGLAGTGTITYTDASGTPTTRQLTIAPHGFLGIYQGNGVLAPPADGAYTAKIAFTGGAQVAAIVNEVAAGGTQSTSYNTFAAGTSTVNVALLENGGSDRITTSVGIMNTGTTQTTVTLSYFNPVTGALIGTAPAATLLPGATAAIYQGYASNGLAAGTSAAATLTASGGGLIAVICNEVGAGVFMSYIGQ